MMQIRDMGTIVHCMSTACPHLLLHLKLLMTSESTRKMQQNTSHCCHHLLLINP